MMITLCFLIVTLVVFASIMYWVSSNSHVTARNNQFNMSEAAAEAAAEKVLSQMNYDYVAQSLTNGGAYYGTKIPNTNDMASWPIQYVYSATNGNQGQISVNIGQWTTNSVPLNSQYTGLYGLEEDVTIIATATPTNVPYTVPATICETIQFASIPLFQFAIFYNMNLEIDPGSTMTIQGRVWSNAGLWTGATCLTLASTVSAVTIATNTANDPFCTGPQYTGTGPAIYSMAGQPTSGNDHITMPIGTNNNPATVEGIINLPPSTYAMGTAAAFTTNGQQYLANEADLYLTNFPNGTNWGALTPRGTNMILYYQDGVNTFSYQTQLPYDFYLITNRGGSPTIISTNFVSATNSPNNLTNIIYAGYSFVTNVLFYDWREGWNSGSGINGKGKAVQAVQIDVASFNAWLANTNMNGSTNVNGGQSYNTQCSSPSHKSHPIDSLYVYNAVPLTSTTLPAVRVVNGGMLPPHTAPRGFSVGTAMPLYVLGNYNVSNTTASSIGQNSTTYTWPAGLLGDSITVLSGSWKDSVTSQMPTPSTTTVNAAMLEGIVASTNGMYSGGLENFIRLLENWSGYTLWYNGSIMVMFPSQYATNNWQQTGNYYNPPTRKWAFDTNFIQQVGLPPLTPQAKGVIRGSWNAY
jgi:hypothetical protein